MPESVFWSDPFTFVEELLLRKHGELRWLKKEQMILYPWRKEVFTRKNKQFHQQEFRILIILLGPYMEEPPNGYFSERMIIDQEILGSLFSDQPILLLQSSF